jgi:hypothetical protein
MWIHLLILELIEGAGGTGETYIQSTSARTTAITVIRGRCYKR